jgi:phosphomannomutase
MENFNWGKLQNGSDIRGVALAGVPGELVNLTPAVATILGQSFATWLGQRFHKTTAELTIGVGRDSRLSGPTLIQAVIAGMTAMGSQVYDFELASTPAMFMSTITAGFECDGAMMLTASHLPFNRNGLKFFTAQGGLQKKDITEILALATTNIFQLATTPGFSTARDFMSVYAQQLVDKIRASVKHPTNFEQPLSGLKIVVDAGNGAGGFYVDRVLQPLGADTTGSQFLEPDGTFPNHIPNPEDPTAIQSICQAVLANQADFGIIFDTDVDRSGAVDRSGKELNRNRVHQRFKRGYKNVIDESIRLNNTGQESWLAIETSGHGALKENYFLDDGAYLISKLLIELAKSQLAGKSLPDLITNLPEPLESNEFRIKIMADDFKSYGLDAIEQLQIFATSQSDWQIVPHNHEGIRISCPAVAEDGWLLLRLSLHDPVMPLNIESNVVGGIDQIRRRLVAFLQTMASLDWSAVQK